MVCHLVIAMKGDRRASGEIIEKKEGVDCQSVLGKHPYSITQFMYVRFNYLFL